MQKYAFKNHLYAVKNRNTQKYTHSKMTKYANIIIIAIL